MARAWGIRNDAIPTSQLITEGFVSIGWDEVGDLRAIGNDRAALRARLAETRYGAKPGALPQWAGILSRFAFEMGEGDLVILPSRQGDVVNIGRIAGPYEFFEDVPEHRHRRSVRWLTEGVPRSLLSESARKELGSLLTLFQVAAGQKEFEDIAVHGIPEAPAVSQTTSAGAGLRMGGIQRAVLEALRDLGTAPRRDVLAEVTRRFPPTSPEREPSGVKGRSRYETSFIWGSVRMRAAGWLEKTPEGWRLTDDGREVLEQTSPEVDLSAISAAAYKQQQDERRARTGRFTTDRYPLIDAAVSLIGEGQWATYKDIAAVSGSNPSAVGEYVHQEQMALEGNHRVVPVGRSPYLDEHRVKLEAEGVGFDERGLPDPQQQVTLEDLRELMDQFGLAPAAPRRAWMVRAQRADDSEAVPGWVADGTIALPAVSLRPVHPGIGRDELEAIIEEDYAHTSYDLRVEKLDDFHAFLSRMQDGHLVVTVEEDRLRIGTLTGELHQKPGSSTGAALVRGVSWADRHSIELPQVPTSLRTRLKVPRDVLDLTQQMEMIEALLDVDAPRAETPGVQELALPEATAELADELHVSQRWLQECVDLLADRPQLIFYGPPGTGKTYLAQAIGRHLAGENVRLVQFHPAYSYEDFFEGYRPQPGGTFALKPGPLRKIVSQARENPYEPYVLIIDEINRGNLAKVFGELYFLLEYRTENVELLYAEEEFNLPENVFIIGTMNTADRSIALVDAAMRRRFSFLPLHPSEEPTRGVLRAWLRGKGRPEVVADLLEELNRRIVDPDFKIGPSYLMRDAVYKVGGLERTWRTSILPLLEEHHYGELSASSVAQRYGLDAVAAAVEASDGGGDHSDAATAAQ